MSTAPSTVKIWYVKDFMSGEAIDGKYFAEKADAVQFRNFIEYGIVSYLEVKE